ncbi:MAG: major capsid protein [Candidatus Dojkabacteria bacterium]|nr:major capsid protein [Candidatus Dojkabacteria bacterium]
MEANQTNTFVWDKIFPKKITLKKKGEIKSLGRQGMQIVDHRISEKGGMHKIDFSVKTSQEFQLQEYGMYAPVYESEIENPDAPIQASRDKVLMLKSIDNLTKEAQALSLALDPANNTNNLQLTLADQFDNPNSDPYIVIKNAFESVRVSSGIRPNSMVLTQDVVNALANHPKVLERMKYTMTATDDEVVAFVKKSFGIQNVYITDTLSRSGGSDIDGGTLSPLVSKKILIYFSSEDAFLMPQSFGRCYMRKEAQVLEVPVSPDVTIKTGEVSLVAVRDEYQFVIANQDAGILLYDVVS